MKQKVVSQWVKGCYIHCQLCYSVAFIVTTYLKWPWNVVKMYSVKKQDVKPIILSVFVLQLRLPLAISIRV
jgi:hypothetical protein